MPRDLNLVSFPVELTLILMPAFWSLLLYNNFCKSPAAPVLPLALHTPFPFRETPPSSPSPNHKRPCSSSPARCSAPFPRPPNVAVLQGKEAGPGWGVGWERVWLLPSALAPIREVSLTETGGPGCKDSLFFFFFPCFCHVPTMDVSPLLRFRLDMWISPAPTQRSFKSIGRCCPGGGACVSSAFASAAAQGAGSAASSFASAAAVAAAAAATCRCAFGGGGVGGGEEGGGGGRRTQRCSRSGAAAQIGEGIFIIRCVLF